MNEQQYRTVIGWFNARPAAKKALRAVSTGAAVAVYEVVGEVRVAPPSEAVTATAYVLPGVTSAGTGENCPARAGWNASAGVSPRECGVHVSTAILSMMRA